MDKKEMNQDLYYLSNYYTPQEEFYANGAGLFNPEPLKRAINKAPLFSYSRDVASIPEYINILCYYGQNGRLVKGVIGHNLSDKLFVEFLAEDGTIKNVIVEDTKYVRDREKFHSYELSSAFSKEMMYAKVFGMSEKEYLQREYTDRAKGLVVEARGVPTLASAIDYVYNELGGETTRKHLDIALELMRVASINDSEHLSKAKSLYHTVYSDWEMERWLRPFIKDSDNDKNKNKNYRLRNNYRLRYFAKLLYSFKNLDSLYPLIRKDAQLDLEKKNYRIWEKRTESITKKIRNAVRKEKELASKEQGSEQPQNQ